MSSPSPVDYQRFSAMVKSKRAGLGLRAAAEEITGVSASTLSRIEQGNVPDLETFMRICAWLGVSADSFRSVPQDNGVVAPSVPEVIEANLRADRVLPKEAVDALTQMIRFAYKAAADGRLKEKEK